jgi:TolA-binding protein
MKTVLLFISSMTFVFILLGQFGLWTDFKNRAELVHNYETSALNLAKENRELRAQLSVLKAQIQSLEAHKNYLSLKVKNKQRKIASLAVIDPDDLVQYEIYNWGPEKLLSIGNKELFKKNFVKSAQFYHEFFKRFPNHKEINDKILFEAGIAAFESKKYFHWAEDHFSYLIEKYPKSSYYRGAKLWRGLSYLYQGKNDKFKGTVEEFRKKYRNTEEWKILSRYYDNINKKVK